MSVQIHETLGRGNIGQDVLPREQGPAEPASTEELAPVVAVDAAAALTPVRTRARQAMIAAVPSIVVTVGALGGVALGLQTAAAVGVGLLGALIALLPVVQRRFDVAAQLRSALLHGFTAYGLLTAGLIALDTATDVIGPVGVTLALSVLAGLLAGVLLSRGAEPVRVMLVGDPEWLEATSATIGGYRGTRLVGVLQTDPSPAYGSHEDLSGISPAFTRLRDTDAVVRCAQEWGADMVGISPRHGWSTTELRRLSWQLEGDATRLAAIGTFEGVSHHRLQAGSLGRLSLVTLRSSRPGRASQVAKAAVDRVLGTLLLLLAAPVIGVAIVAIRLESRGRGIFTQERIGRHGKPFTMYKLRTMYSGADRDRLTLQREGHDGNGLLFKLKSDPRVTRVGKLLRVTSLDELPQLLNVVRGDMSLVGPRPALATEVAQYERAELRRLAVRPGLTGLWQVSGRSDLSREESLELDLYYADNWSLSGDFAIACRTINAVVSSRGAY